MKQLILLSVLTVAGGIGALSQPFWGVLLYYLLTVLRPQHLWAWALPMEVRWSLIAALIVLVCFALNLNTLSRRFKLNAVAVMMFIYCLLLLGSVLTAFDPHTAQSWGVEYAKILLIALVASVLIERLWHVRMLMYMILSVLGHIAAQVTIQMRMKRIMAVYDSVLGMSLQDQPNAIRNAA
jgi:hypothetical protein